MNKKITASLSHRLFLSEQVRANELGAARKCGISSFELMQKAGRSVFELIESHYAHVCRIAVVVGSGNNGGDGFICAALAQQAGYQVELFATKNIEPKGDAKTAMQQWLASGGKVKSIGEFNPSDHGLIIDAILGTGISGSVTSPVADVIQAINDAVVPVISVDIPSGLCADSGRILGCAVRATQTVTFIAVKPGLVTGKARDVCGQLLLNELQIAESFAQLVTPFASTIEINNYSSELACRAPSSYKTQHGKILCIGGYKGMAGAIRLTAEAALRTGCGMVKVLTHQHSVLSVANGRPELMVESIDSDMEQLKRAISWCDVIVIGPGLSQSQWGQWLMDNVIAHRGGKPLVVDADGLNMLAKQPSTLAGALLTPHSGEAARLLGSSIEQVESNRYHSAVQIQQKFGATCILKGAGTLVASSQTLDVCLAGNAGMAVAGMGDLLAGICGTAIGLTKDIPLAAKIATNLHAQAGDLAAKNGQSGMLASDLFIPLRKLINFPLI